MWSTKCFFHVNKLMISWEKDDNLLTLNSYFYYVCLWLGDTYPSRILFGSSFSSNFEANGPVKSQFCTCHMCIIVTRSNKIFSYMSNMVFSCDQAALQMVFSVCLSVRLSIRPSVCLSHLFHHVPIIVSSWNFQELLPWSKVMSMQKVKVRGQRSRSQRSTPNLAVSGL